MRCILPCGIPPRRPVGFGPPHSALATYDDLAIRIWPVPSPMRHRCLQLAHNVSADDAAYVALAESLDAPLVTRDAKLAAAAPRPLDVRLV